jgi:hypothetical protein
MGRKMTLIYLWLTIHGEIESQQFRLRIVTRHGYPSLQVGPSPSRPESLTRDFDVKLTPQYFTRQPIWHVLLV